METSFTNICKFSSLLGWYYNSPFGIKGNLQQCRLWGEVLQIQSLTSHLCHAGIKEGQLLRQAQGFVLFGSLAVSAPRSRPATHGGEEELTQLYLPSLHSSEKWAAHSRAERRCCSAWCRSQEHCIMQINTPTLFRIFLSSWHKRYEWHDISLHFHWYPGVLRRGII